MPGRTAESGGGYRFGYTGHEAEDEITSGIYSTESRLLNTRLGLWMTPDPLSGKYVSFSSYNYCENNPLIFIDSDGKEKHMFFTKKEIRERFFATNYRNDNRLHIFAHGNIEYIAVPSKINPKKKYQVNEENFDLLMNEEDHGMLWDEYKMSGFKIPVEVVLHVCYSSQIAKKLSEKYPNAIFTGANARTVSVGKEEKGPFKFVSEELGLYLGRKQWESYQNGILIRSQEANSPSPFDPKNGLELPNDLKGSGSKSNTGTKSYGSETESFSNRDSGSSSSNGDSGNTTPQSTTIYITDTYISK